MHVGQTTDSRHKTFDFPAELIYLACIFKWTSTCRLFALTCGFISTKDLNVEQTETLWCCFFKYAAVVSDNCVITLTDSLTHRHTHTHTLLTLTSFSLYLFCPVEIIKHIHTPSPAFSLWSYEGFWVSSIHAVHVFCSFRLYFSGFCFFSLTLGLSWSGEHFSPAFTIFFFEGHSSLSSNVITFLKLVFSGVT